MNVPVPVSTIGPLHLLAARVHRMANDGRSHEALPAADAYLALARATGDTRTVPFLLQGKMYANLSLGRITEAAALGAEILRLQQAAGNRLGEAKVRCDLAQIDVRRARYVDGLRNLARAGVLLDSVPDGDPERRRSALCSFADAAAAAELYETAAGTYEQLSGASASFELVHAVTLLYWGIRLGHVGRAAEGSARLRRSAEITRRRVTRHPGDVVSTAMLALALAELGDVVPAEKLAREVVLPLRAAENYQYARMAHLALGVSFRGQGALTEARRELRAAQELCAYSPRPDEAPIIRYETALTARATDDGPAARDLHEVVAEQMRELWRMRQLRLAMLRQARQREEAEREIMCDPLTGLGNRRQFDALLARAEAPLCLVILDVDHFKAVNDACSHSAGDRALRAVAAIVRRHCRAPDVPVRYAGDEFAVFLRGDLAAGRAVAERIRAAVAGADILPGVRLTVSAGLAELTGGMTGDDLFRRADERLYAAKWSGRDTVAA
jgi:diguanylate cyclase